MKIKTLVFDFNGTLIDDVFLCLELLNEALGRINKPSVEEDAYKERFTFPVIDYYRAVGFAFDEESFHEVAVAFDRDYKARFHRVKPFADVEDSLKELGRDHEMIVLSATKQGQLIDQLKAVGLLKYFKAAIGTKDIYASSKMGEAKEYFLDRDMSEVLFIGDTLHDNEVAKELGGSSILIARGHQSKHRLLDSDADMVIDDMASLKEAIDKLESSL